MTKKIVLASKSPRRKQILETAGFSCEVRIQDTDESFPPDLDSDKVAEYIALQKAAIFTNHIGENEIIIAADTIVVFEEQILGKPKDKQEAIDFIQMMSGKEHIVYTGVCIQAKDKNVVFTGKSLIKFYPISMKETIHYIDQYQPFDKAGAYGIQEWLGYNKVEYINGSYTNIAGLPMELVYHHLQDFL